MNNNFIITKTMKNASLIQYDVYNLFINSADLNNNQLLFNFSLLNSKEVKDIDMSQNIDRIIYTAHAPKLNGVKSN